MDERLKQILRCMRELEVCEQQLKTNACPDPLLPLMGQMDWLEELHHHIYLSN